MTEPLRPSHPDELRWDMKIMPSPPGKLLLRVWFHATPLLIKAMLISLQRAREGQGVHRWLARFLTTSDDWHDHILTDLTRPPGVQGSAP